MSHDQIVRVDRSVHVMVLLVNVILEFYATGDN